MSLPSQGGRFVLVGLANTALDVGVLWWGLRAGLALVPANLISTTAGLTFSFLVNRRFTFRFRGSKSVRRQVAEFVGVTLVGLWLLQPPVILAVSALATSRWLAPEPALLAGKLVATGVSLVWNFVLYRWVVFRPDPA